MEFSDRVAPPISTFEALLGFIHVSWLNLGALLFVPPEGVTVKRSVVDINSLPVKTSLVLGYLVRYLSIRVGIHQQRKELNKSAPSQDILSFGLYEYEYRTGINYVRVICPWSTGVSAVKSFLRLVSHLITALLPKGRLRRLGYNDR